MKGSRKVLNWLLLAVFCFSLGMFVFRMAQSYSASQSYQEAEKLAGLNPELVSTPTSISVRQTEAETATEPLPTGPSEEAPTQPQAVMIEDAYAEELLRTDLNSLRKVNPDVLGWILVPGTRVSYPIVQGDDNEYYLTHTWDLRKKIAGSVCMDYLCSDDFKDFNTIVYGHNMNDLTMFATLHRYQKQSFWEENQYVYIVNDAGAFRYRVFAAYDAPLESSTYYVDIQKDSHKEQLIAYALEQSLYDTGIIPTVEDSILTLITCTGTGYEDRWAVQAVLEGQITPPHEDVQ